MGECIYYEDDEGYYNKVFACWQGSLRDLTFTRYDLDLQDETIVPIFTVIKPSDLTLYRQLNDSFQTVHHDRPIFVCLSQAQKIFYV